MRTAPLSRPLAVVAAATLLALSACEDAEKPRRSAVDAGLADAALADMAPEDAGLADAALGDAAPGDAAARAL